MSNEQRTKNTVRVALAYMNTHGTERKINRVAHKVLDNSAGLLDYREIKNLLEAPE